VRPVADFLLDVAALSRSSREYSFFFLRNHRMVTHLHLHYARFDASAESGLASGFVEREERA
jgi:hypothetical protein